MKYNLKASYIGKSSSFVAINLIFILFITCTKLNGQESISSSEANKLSSSVGEFTGSLNINIPLASVSSGKLSLPIGLSYVADGLKPGTVGGPVGLNWIINDNFVINRLQRDDFDYKKRYNVHNILIPYNYCPTCSDSQVMDESTDGARDIFTYYLGGIRGNFYRDNNNCILLKKEDLKIEYISTPGPDSNSFVVTLTDGSMVNLKGIADSYLPTKYISYDLKDTIKFEYQNTKYSTPTLIIPAVSPFPNVPACVIGTRVDTVAVLRKLIGYNDTIEFTIATRNDISAAGISTPDVRYNNLMHKTDSTCVKYTFDSDYFEDETGVKTQLRLKSLKQSQCTAPYDSIPSYYFEYYGTNNTNGTQFCPKKSTTGLDSYGYYNGITTNTASNMIPTGVGNGAANRSIVLEPTKVAMLKKVTIPTGGTISYEYEQNKFRYAQENKVTIFELQACNDNVSTCSGIYGDTMTVAMNTTMINTGKILMNYYPHDTGSYSPYGYDYVLKIKNTGGGTLHTISFNQAINNNPAYFEINLADIKDYLGNQILQNGVTYNFELLTVDGRGTAVAQRLEISAEVNAGGIRVSKITETDLLTPKITQYTYENGMVYNVPKFHKTNNNGTATFYMLSDLFDYNFLFPYHIGYAKVTASIANQGKTVTYFKNNFIQKVDIVGSPIAFQYPSATSKLTNNVGSIQSVETWSNTNQLIQKDSFEYFASVLGSPITQKEVFIEYPTGSFLSNYYSIEQYDNRIKKQYSYYLGALQQTTELTYGHAHTVNPSLVKVTTGNGQIAETWTDYTNNCNTGTQIKNYFIQKNIILPYTGQSFINSISVSGYVNNYAFYNAAGAFVGLTSSNSTDAVRASQNFIYQYDLNGTLTGGTANAEQYFHTYDSGGLIVSHQKLNWPNVTTTYDRKRPIITEQNGFSTSTTYIGKSNLVKRKYNVDNTYTEFYYDGIQRLKKTIQMPANIQNEYFYTYPTALVPFNSIKTKTTYPVVASSGLNIVENVNYLDKLGRKVASVAVKASPTQNDIITCYAYDSLGRLIREYLPVETTNNNGSYIYPGNTGSITAGQVWKYKETKYDNSPFSRVKEVIPPDWYATKYDYGLNVSTDAVNKQTSGTYGINELIKETVTDGNGNKTIVFKDFSGRLILQRQTDASDTPAKRRDTYTHYDNKGRVTKVIPPDATSSTPELVYEYTYDDEDKLKTKKIPGKGWMSYYYNNKDLLAVEQDAIQAAKSTKEWLVNLYDINGRLVKSGLNVGASLPDLQNPSFTKVYTENIYGTSAFEKDKVKTSKVNILGTSDFINKTFTFDTRGRVQSFTSNNVLKLTASDINSFVYDNGDNIITHMQPLSVTLGGTNTTYSKEDSYTYDHRGRTIEENFKYGTGSVQNLATNVYNYRSDLSQVKQGKFNSTTFLQTIDYAYKSNGLLSGINQYLGTATTGDLFYEELFYDNNLSGSTAVSRKNGEISNIKWQRRNSTILGGVHAYTYNEFGEILVNNYYNLTGATTFTGTAKFDESFDYSGKYGKINSHLKFDYTGSLLDNLTYNYVANSPRAANVNDSSGNSIGHNQNGQPTSGNVYTYDLNGNQRNDPYRGVDSIKYNYLNLPDTIFLSGSKRVVMSYDAVGNMLHKKVYNTGLALIENRTYTSGFEFVAYGTGTQALEMVHHSQGYYRISTTKHEYTIADHLGNTRIVYTDTNGNGVVDQSEILDENHYYAYGMEMSDPAFLNNSIYKYKFNGIERTESLGLVMDLALYRGLDPVLGKWYQVDPKAEAMMGMSPYCAMGNNPVLHTDPKGDILPAIAIAALIGGAVGGVANVALNWQDITASGNPWGRGLAAFGIGAVAGGIGAATGTYAVMGSAAFAAGGAAAGATGVSLGGYTLGTTGFVTGAISGTVGGAVGSTLRQTGNVIAGFQEEFSFKSLLTETLLSGAIGGGIGGFTALAKGQNFWWGNSVKISPNGFIQVGIDRVVNSKTISEFAENQNILTGQDKIWTNKVQEYFDIMDRGAFDAAKHAREIGGFVNDGKYILTSGNHRVAASIAHGMKTGDYSILETLIRGGRWTSGNPVNYGYLNKAFPTKWK